MTAQNEPQGSPTFSSTSGVAVRDARLDDALAALQVARGTWARTPLTRRIEVIDEVLARAASVGDEWARQSARGKLAPEDPYALAQERLAGIFSVVRHLGQIRRALVDVERRGRPRLPGRPRALPGGGVSVRVLPQTALDPLIFGPTFGDVWLGEDVTPENFEERHAAACRPPHPDGHLRLVLGAGNHALLPVGDALEAVFLRGETVLVKLNPVNADMRDVVESLFAPLLALGVVRVVTGGADVGAYLCAHEAVESVQLTGSDKTYDAVVFGAGEEGAARKARGEPLLRRPVTAELGGVSPTIVVPGPWTARDIEYAAHGVAYGMTHNGGFNCNTTRLLVQHEGWAGREAFLTALGGILARVPTRAAYYPGAGDRWRVMTLAHPHARRYGEPAEGHLPWTLATHLDPRSDDPAFTFEAFCSFAAETALPARDAAAFLDAAVEFVNGRVFGNLNMTLLVHPASLRDPGTRAALDRAVRDLRYGTVAVNVWGGYGFATGITPWGAYPGNTPTDIGSGVGFIHNPLMLPDVRKSVLRSPLRPLLPSPALPLFSRHDELSRLLLPLVLRPSPRTALALAGPLMRGR